MSHRPLPTLCNLLTYLKQNAGLENCRYKVSVVMELSGPFIVERNNRMEQYEQNAHENIKILLGLLFGDFMIR